MSEAPLLAPEFRARLAALEVALRRALPSDRRGDRRSPHRKGISLEFADHRGYVPGDDVRHLDWSAYARLDQLVVKLYHDEEDAQVHLLVDDSRSMEFGIPSKARYARQVAAALAWIGLQRAARVTATLLRDPLKGIGPVQGAGALVRVLELLDAPPGGGRRPLPELCREFMGVRRPRGAVVLVSDLLDGAGAGALLRELQRTATDVSLIHVLAEDELDPALEGDLRLLDAETGERVEVHLEPGVIETYRQRVRGWIAGCAEACRGRGAGYAWTSTARTIEDLFLRDLVRERVLR